MTCKICGSEKSKVIGKPRANKNLPKINLNEYRIIQCGNCSFYYIHPDIELNQDEWTELYKDDYFANKHDSEWLEKLNSKERTDRVKLIKKNLQSNNGNYLDIGCGEGFVLNEALANGFTPFGLDIANNLHDSVDMEVLDFFEGNIFDANYKENYFSAIYMDSILEHVDDPISLLKEIYRVLKPNGIGFLIVPNEDSLINDTKQILYTLMLRKDEYGRIKPFVPPYHINGFNPKSLKYAIESVGLRMINLTQFAGDYKFYKAYKPFSKAYFRELILYPSGLLSIILNKQYQIQALFTK
jgi:ubiquinone/menaquinone biosynthesis C-methylase UbiE